MAIPNDLREAALKNHEITVARVEALISRIYAVKDKNDHRESWFVECALESYKAQSTALLKMLLSGACGEHNKDEIMSIRRIMDQQVDLIADMISKLTE